MAITLKLARVENSDRLPVLQNAPTRLQKTRAGYQSRAFATHLTYAGVVSYKKSAYALIEWIAHHPAGVTQQTAQPE